VTEAPQRLLDAVVAVLVEEGFEGVSVRKVAARAGVSIGAVQHHFPTKDVMLTAAMDRASAEFGQRLSARIPANPTAEHALRAVADELLVSDRNGARPAWSGCPGWPGPASTSRRGGTHAREWQEVEDLLSRLLQAARPGVDPHRSREDASGLLALLDGLAMAALAEPDWMPPERAERLLAAVLDGLLH